MSKISVDQITDEDGNGAPNLVNGIQIAGVAVSSTAAEINLIDGGTARGTTALADGDGILINDAGTMRMSTVQTVKTYMTAGVGGGSMVFIASSGAISDGTATVAFTAFDASKFDHYVFMLQHVKPVNDQVLLLCQTSTDGGSNFATTSGNYRDSGSSNRTGLSASNHMGNANTEFGVSGRFEIYAPHVSSANTYALAMGAYMGIHVNIKNNAFSGQSASRRVASENNNAVRFLCSSGNIKSGEIVMYGIANA